MYAQARKWQNKNWDPDMADSKFKVSHSQGSIFFPLKVRQHFLMPTCSFKRKTISPLCPVSQREVGKSCALNLPPCLRISQEKATGARALVHSQAWQAAARELGSRCLSPGGGNSLDLF